MIKIAAIAIQVLAVAGGAFVGVTLSNGSSSQSATEEKGASQKEEKAEKEKPKKEKKKKAKKGGKDGGGYGEAGDGSGFMKFSRQFIVPVVTRDNVSALVILDINLELTPSATENAYAREPKIRDALLKTLLQLSNEGAFGGDLLDEENLTDIRGRLQTSARSVLGDDVIGVLILNVARQDV